MALSGLIGPGQVFKPRSVTIIRTDPLPDLPKGASAKARLASGIRAIALMSSDVPNKDKWKADAATSQSHGGELELTSHPVETGFRITDHSREVPGIFEFTGILSDTPTTPLGFVLTQAQALSFTSRAHDEFQRFLDNFFKPREPVFIATSLRVYTSYIIKSWNVERDPDSGAAIEINVVANEIQIRDSVLGAPLIDDDAIFLGAGPGENGGTLPITPTESISGAFSI